MIARKFGFLALALALVLFALAACTPQPATLTGTPVPGGTAKPPPLSAEAKWEQTVAAAKTEGNVMVYGEMSTEVRDAIAKGMKDKYGIQADFVVGKAPEVAQKFLTERNANINTADNFVLGAGTLLLTMKPRGVLMPIAPALIQPGVTDPAVWPGGNVPYMDKDNMALPIAARYTSLMIRNTQMTTVDDIQTFRDLLNPKWKGKMVMFDPTITGSSSNWTTFILSKLMTWDDGKKFLRDFAKQEPVIIKDPRLPVEWVARGKNPIGIGPTFATVPEFQDAGAPIAWIKVKDGGLIVPGAGVFALPDKPAHPNASLVLTNWLFSKEGQTAFSQAFGAPAVRVDVSRVGIDPLIIAQPGDKIYINDEDFIVAQSKALELAKEVFASLLK